MSNPPTVRASSHFLGEYPKELIGTRCDLCGIGHNSYNGNGNIRSYAYVELIQSGDGDPFNSAIIRFNKDCPFDIKRAITHFSCRDVGSRKKHCPECTNYKCMLCSERDYRWHIWNCLDHPIETAPQDALTFSIHKEELDKMRVCTQIHPPSGEHNMYLCCLCGVEVEQAQNHFCPECLANAAEMKCSECENPVCQDPSVIKFGYCEDHLGKIFEE
jgi:hypothetical protein